VDDPGFVGEHHGLGAVSHTDFGEEVPDVCAPRRLAQAQPSGNLGVGQAAGEQDEHLAFPVGHPVQARDELGRTRPRIAALAGVTTAISVVGLSMHHTFYYQALADLAGIPDHDATARLLAEAATGRRNSLPCDVHWMDCIESS
jgi:hypothetical protein